MPEAGVSTTEAEKHFGEILDRAAVAKERIALTRGGEVIAALVPAEDLSLLEEIEDWLDAEDARRALEEHQRSGDRTIPLREIARRLGIAL